MNKVIALDIGNVCVTLRHDLALGALGYKSLGDIPADFLKATEMMERGLMPENDWLETYRKCSGTDLEDDKLRSIWNLIIGSEMDGMADAVKKAVAKGCRVIFFSDTSDLHMTAVYRNLSFVHLVSGGIFSYKEGAKKPEARMYEAFEEKYGKPAYYTDDLPHNIEAAVKRGWNAGLFTGAKSFADAVDLL